MREKLRSHPSASSVMVFTLRSISLCEADPVNHMWTPSGMFVMSGHTEEQERDGGV